MDVNCALSFRRASLVAAAVLGIAVSAPASSQFRPTVFTGGGYGPTADVAIQSAIWDAENSASYYQLYNCEQVGEIMIFTRPNPRWGRNFTAQVTVTCSS